MRELRRILVANRGEIAIRIFRACTELGKQTVALYSEQDALSLHRYKADEAYLVGEGKGPIAAYLEIDAILDLAERHKVDAIHPGYGFLSENAAFARRCQERGIVFIGPDPEHLAAFGDKVRARQMAIDAGLPVPLGTDGPVDSADQALAFARQSGFPLIVKAVSGGGGRGMRVVRSEAELVDALERAASEAQAAFGDGSVYLEQYIERPRHIEVQVIADRYGNVVHLFERDCSIQRRHQKIVEVAPSLGLTDGQRQEICAAAVRLLARSGYVCAGTVEFLLAPDGRYYFMEVNPRVQVEHTITELITGLDIVQAQIKIAEGQRLDQALGVSSQAQINRNGWAIQCRITTEDPENDFYPDTGRILAYRAPGGLGVRLDEGNGYAGAIVTPHYDSLLVKACTWGLDFGAAAHKMGRVLQEFRIRGVKTNIPFLSNVIEHPDFLAGRIDTAFLTEKPELFQFPPRRDRGTKLLRYIGQVVVGGGPGPAAVGRRPDVRRSRPPEVGGPVPAGARKVLLEQGPEGFIDWIKAQKRLLLTDTTMRDAHQSLLATRMRSRDLLAVAEATARLVPGLFSLEVWGGATFDSALRFLKEDPWERLAQLRERIPNIPFQMLLRGANGVGYAAYPDNLIQAFVREAKGAGVDIFRIFDALNWMEQIRPAVEAVRQAGGVAEVALCYTGDILDSRRTKYDLGYYVRLAEEAATAGAHLLAIKDMSGLLKPGAAAKLVKALHEATGLPIHVHTHDTAGNGVATLLAAAAAGAQIVDGAIDALSGITSQPSLGALIAATAGSEQETGIDLGALQQLDAYWREVRPLYAHWETGLLAPSSEVYLHEIPGGQYANLRQQAESLGLGNRWSEVLSAYTVANELVGDIVKVTPSSKAVGDLALFMVQNGLNAQNILVRGEALAFPESVVQMLAGQMGQPPGGWPVELQRVVLKGREAIQVRPGLLQPPVDLVAEQAALSGRLGRPATERETLSALFFPGLVEALEGHRAEFGDTSMLDTLVFFWGLRPGEETAVEIEQGKRLIIKLIAISEPRPDGMRDIAFELNGQPREIRVADPKAGGASKRRPKAEKGDPTQVGASMPGKVLRLLVASGDRVTKGMQLLVTEAMKMENALTSPCDGVVVELLAAQGDAVEAGDLLVRLRPE